MIVMVDGKEIELKDNLEKGMLELDKLTEEEKIDLEDTIELTDEMLKKIEEMSNIEDGQ